MKGLKETELSNLTNLKKFRKLRKKLINYHNVTPAINSVSMYACSHSLMAKIPSFVNFLKNLSYSAFMKIPKTFGKHHLIKFSQKSNLNYKLRDEIKGQ